MRRAVRLLPIAVFIVAFMYSGFLNRKPGILTGEDLERMEELGPVGQGSERPRRGPELERWYFQQWHAPYGNVLEPGLLDQIWRQVRALPSESDFAGATINSWDLIGPFGMNSSGGSKYSGRILDIEVDNGASTRIAAASGGLWGFVVVFPAPLSDQVSSLAVSTFTSDPNDNAKIIIGTGEPLQRGGTGLYRTTNTGTSWTPVTLSPQPSGFFRIRYTPGSSSVVHAATNQGYFRSDNGGSSFTRRLTGVTPDIAIHPTNPQILFSAIWGGSNNGIYRSTDGGNTWTKLTGGGIPTSNIGRTAISICTSSPSTVYISIGRDDDDSMLGVYKSTNATDATPTWSDVSPSTNFLGNQGWYDNVIGVCPTNANICLVGGVTLQRTTNGGTSWSEVSTSHVHVDHHAITWNAAGTQVWNGNDGGISTSADAGATWSTSANLLPITQYVNIDVDPNNNVTFAGGSQDNGMSLTANNGSTWTHVLGGDGGGVVFDLSTQSADAQRLWITLGVYGGDWAFRRLRSTNNGSNWSFINTNIDPSSQWYHKIRNDRVPPVYLYNNSGPFVYESTDFGDTWSKTNLSAFPVDVANLDVSQYVAGGAVLYASLSSATAGQRLRVYDGGTWVERSTGLVSGVSVRGVATHPRGTNVDYALMNGLSDGNKVYKTTDRGVNWTNISGNLPNVPMGDLVAHPTQDALLYVGTEMGCYRTTNGGANWHRWNNGLPEATIVTELKYIDSVAINGKFYIVAGTYGRGMWKRDVSGDDVAAVNPVAGVPETFSLDQNYPNPFNPSTTIRFSIPVRDHVELKVFDIRGREVATLVDDMMESGSHESRFDASGLSSGVYFARLRTPKQHEIRKMTLLK